MAMTDFVEILKSPSLSFAEGLEFLRGRGMLNETLRRLADDLDRHGIAYAIVGAIALNQHGYRRFTEDIDVLVSPEGLERFRAELVGRGYRPAFGGAARKFRSADHNVPVEFITSGEYPGDGKPKPVEFPIPEESFTVIDGIRTLTLERLIELKLASGMTAPDRLKDLADVQELIRVKGLGGEFAAKLDPYVREKFGELIRTIADARDRG